MVPSNMLDTTPRTHNNMATNIQTIDIMTTTTTRSKSDYAGTGQHGTTRPIFGVLTQPVESEERFHAFTKDYSEYIPASFVRWLESGGARVIPIQYATSVTSARLLLRACFAHMRRAWSCSATTWRRRNSDTCSTA
jgi:hypothetical protein